MIEKSNSILEKTFLEKTIRLRATNGSKNLVNSKNIFKFFYLDASCENKNFDNRQAPTKKIKINIYKGARVADFATMFNSLTSNKRSVCFTQHQIINFCRRNKKYLSNWPTFFLFEEGEQFFIARVTTDSWWRGLCIIIYNFNFNCCFGSEESYRVAVPA